LNLSISKHSDAKEELNSCFDFFWIVENFMISVTVSNIVTLNL